MTLECLKIWLPRDLRKKWKAASHKKPDKGPGDEISLSGSAAPAILSRGSSRDEPSMMGQVFPEAGESTIDRGTVSAHRFENATLDLWKVAFDRLETKQQKRLLLIETGYEHRANDDGTGESSPSMYEILNNIIDCTQDIYQRHETNRQQSGRVEESMMSFHGAAKKIIDAALSVQPVISNIVACDASGYATLAWFILSFGLAMIQNKRGSQEALLESSEIIADILAQTTFAETKYRDGDAEQRSVLEGPIIGSYTAILRYASEVISVRDSGLGRKIITSLTPSDEQPLQIFKQSLDEQKEKLKSLKLDHYFSQGEKANGILKAISENIEQLIADSWEKRNKETLNWLTPIDCDSDQRHNLSLRTKDTLEWLIGSEAFKQWERDHTRPLYCEGQAGAGKTVATATVIQHLQEKYRGQSRQGHQGIGIAFIYCKENRTPEPAMFLSVLLKQLCRTKIRLPTCVTQIHKEYKRTGKVLSYDDVLAALQSVIEGEYAKVFIAIDALNEYKKDHREKVLKSMIEIKERSSKLHLFTTSQSDVSIRKTLQNASILNLAATPEDIEKYLIQEIEVLTDLLVLKKNDDLKQLTMTTIDRSASGSFLLVRLHLQRLKSCGTANEVRKALQNLPNRDEFYAKAIEDIKARSHHKAAFKVLNILTFATRDLNVEEIRHAFAVRRGSSFLDSDDLPEITHIGSICAPLVTIDLESDKIELSHPTAKEYLTKQYLAYELHTEVSLARICIIYLAFEDFQNQDCDSEDELTSRIESYPFYEYAAQNWASHLQEPQADSETEELAIKLLCSNAVASFSQVLQSNQGQISLHTCMNGFHVAAWFGLSGLLPALLNSEGPEQLDGLDNMGRTPLLLAVHHRRGSTVEKLLRAGADTEAQDAWGRTALLAAVHNRDDEVSEILIDWGAVIDCPDHQGRTPLSWAAQYGVMRIAELLIAKGAVVDFQDNSGRSPLSFAFSEPSRREIHSLLLSKGADINLTDAYRRTPASWAAQLFGKKDLFGDWVNVGQGEEHEFPNWSYIQEAACLDIVDCYGWTARIWKNEADRQRDSDFSYVSSCAFSPALPQKRVSHGGHEERRFRHAVAGPDDRTQPDDYGRTKMSAAAKGGLTEFMIHAIDEKVDPNTADSQKATLLSWAAEYGHYELATTLLDRGADPNLVDSFHRTPLSWAAAGGWSMTVRVLLERGSSSDTQDCNGQTPLSLAASSGKFGVVATLLEHNTIHSDTADNWARTPLSWAAKVGNRRVVQALFDSENVNIDQSDIWGWTPLSRAASNGCAVLVRDLLAMGADPNARDNAGRSPLLRACQRGNASAVDSLLSSQSISVHCPDSSGRTPLSWAAEFGHEKVVQRLLNRGADSQVADSSGRIPLSWAAQRGRRSVVKLLVANDAWIASRDHGGRTPLSWAAEYDHEAIVEMLIERDICLLDSADSNRWTPLMWAARYGHEAIVKMLLDRRASIHSRSIGERTALSLALVHGHEKAVITLWRQSAVEGE